VATTLKRYEHIDAVRAIAVMLVVIAHAGLGHLIPGGSGVTIFFAISGFIITTVLLKEWKKTGRFDIGGFYIRRAVKLVPPLVVALIIPTLIYATLGGVINWNAFGGQILFYFNWVKLDHPQVLPGSPVVWSLSIEEQFYIVFAALWLWLVRSSRTIPWLAGLSVVVIITSTALRFVLADPGNEQAADRIYYGSDTRADSLAWGILAAIALYKWQKSGSPRGWFQRISGSQWALNVAVLVFLVSLVIRDDWFRQTLRYPLQSTSTCVVILYGFTATPGVVHRVFAAFCRVRLVQLIGLASYSIYLVHLSIIMTIDDLTKKLPLLAHAAIGTALAVATGYAMYRWIEMPARKRYEEIRDRRSERQQRQASATTPVTPVT
jgi:peptidoglycan/LPS O-acetylase OafA/YrhL